MVALINRTDLEQWIDKELDMINEVYRTWKLKNEDVLHGRQVTLIRLQDILKQGKLDFKQSIPDKEKPS